MCDMARGMAIRRTGGGSVNAPCHCYERSTAPKVCHPERLKKIEDFRRESKDLRTELTANVDGVRRERIATACGLAMTW